MLPALNLTDVGLPLLCLTVTSYPVMQRLVLIGNGEEPERRRSIEPGKKDTSHAELKANPKRTAYDALKQKTYLISHPSCH